MTTDDLRAKFEAALREEIIVGCDDLLRRVGNGYEDINLNLAWRIFQAAYASRDAEVEALRKRINDAPVYYVPTKKPDSEDGWLQVIGSVKALNDMRGKHVRLVIDAAMRDGK